MDELPRDRRLDSTLDLLRAPYDFISSRCKALGSDVFETRLMLRKTICMTGKEAARLFYDGERFQRRHAAPIRLQHSLLGTRGVQTIDDEAHLHRKRMFLALMSAERLQQLNSIFSHEFMLAAQRWSSMDRIVLYDALHEVLTRSICRWAGVPLDENEVAMRTAELTAMFDRPGAVGPPHWRSRRARNRAERWCADLIQAIRKGQIKVSHAGAVYRIAFHRDHEDRPLSAHTAAIELLNVLRPTVALSVYIVFIAHALHAYPRCREALANAERQYAEWFVHEVRRFYPFFPAVPALVRHDFDWKGYHFPARRRVMLDLHGVNHDPRLWSDPERFEPERFREWDGDPFNFIPQGGGDHAHGHRCAGERLTTELMKTALDLLAFKIRYDIPAQDLSIETSRLPALPCSKFVIENVRIR